MALTEQDREYIHEAAVNAARDLCQETIREMLKWHLESCPHGKSLLASKWAIIGVCIGSSIGSGTVVAGIMTILT